MKKRLLSLLTAFSLCLTLIPTTVFADDEKRGEDVSPSICETACTEESKLGKEQPNAIAEDEGSSAPADDELGSDAVAAEASPVAMRAANGISARAANSGTIYLGNFEINTGYSSASYDYYNGKLGYAYDASTQTLTLKDYNITSYHQIESGLDDSYFKYYNVFLDCRAVGRLTIVLEGNNYIGGDSYLNMYASSTSNKDTPRYMGILGNTVIFSGSGSLTVKTQMYPIQAGGVQVLGNATLNLYSHMDGTAVKQMEVCSGATVNAEVQGSELPYCGLKVSKSGSGNGSLTVSGTLSVTTKGCQYGSSSSLLLAPIALYVPDNSILIDGGIMTVIANGRKNGGDGCQSYGIAAKSMKLDHGGRVEAYSRGYNSKTNTYDGKEAIYLTGSLEVGINCRLYAKIENPQFNNDDTYGAIKVNGEQWILEKTDQDSGGTYTTAVVTNPVNGYPRGKAVYGFRASAAKEVEIRGLTEAMLVLSYCKSDTNEGKTYYYRNAETPGDTDSDRQKIYQYASRPNVELNLQEGFGTIRPLDYNSYYGIDVKQGEHTIVMGGLTILRDHTFITVRGGATLNLKLANWSYLGCGRGGSAPTIQVEAGGTLNITGVSMNKTSLALAGGIAAESGATVNIKNCAVYVPGKTIGGSGAAVTIENSWASSDYAGNLLVKTSTLEGKYAGGGTVKIDRGSNANLTDASGKAVTGVTDHSGNAVYRTKIALEDMDKSRNKTAITYRTDSNPNGVTLCLFPKVTLLRVNVPSSANDTVITGLNIPVDNNIIYLWLPAGTKIINVEGFQDDGSSPVGFIHDPGQNAQIITTADNNASGTLILRNLLLGSGILALKGTPAGNNTQICAGYLNDNTKDKWIGYDPAKEIKLEADVPYVKEFGIRMLTGGEAEVKLNGLYLSGLNKRVEVDNGAKLSVILMENTENSMAAASGTDAVWTLKGSGGLTIRGQSGGEKLKLAGDHAIDGSTGASLTLDGITLVNLCTKKQETALGSLTINGSTVLGLGTVNCSNVVINGGSVDLDVPVNTVVKDSGGNELKKVTLTLSEKNAAVEDVTLSGLPEGTAFNDSHITSDGSGKLYLWIPKNAEVETVTVGGNKYYPKSDGSMTIGDVPEFTSPTEDVSRVVEISEYMTLTVGVTGTPAPALQWQVSRDGGNTWEKIEGATKATYQADLPFSLHGAKFRCAATNKDGTTYSHTFTAYYYLAYLRGAASPMRGNGEFIQGETATITAGFYDGQTWYPISSLTGVTAKYRWKICGNDVPTEEEWAAIPPASESYPITITDEMDYQRVCFHVTLTYPDNTVKTAIGSRQLYVCVTPVVTEQPQSVSAAVGDSVTFSAKLIKQYLNTLEYQWQSSADGGQNWTDIEGAGGKSAADSWNYTPSYTPSYTIPSVTAAQSGQLFRCVLWNTNNRTGSDRVSTPPVYSEPATLTVTPPAHEHTYGGWSHDETDHWRECSDEGCTNRAESIKDKAAHDYDNEQDTTCSVCGYERTVTPPAHEHSYGDWSKDGTNHWHECTDADCPNRNESIKDKAAHVYDDDADTTCDTCGYERTITPPAHEHRYGDWSKDGTNHWHECTDAACPNQPESIKDTEAHIYTDDADTTCNTCGYERTVTPPAHEHSYGDWSKDGTNHWHECTDADCPNRNESIKDKAAHVYDDDADTTCDTCGYERTITPPAHEHRYGDWSKDGTNHWHECTDAACPNQPESIKDTEAHIYTDDADTTCDTCGYDRTVTPEIVPVSQITLNKAETSISVGNSETLTATVAPENAANKALKWASSDEDVATVAPDGTVTAVKVGTATITATATDGSGKSAVCTVTVTGDTTPSQPGGSTGGSSGGSSSDRDSSDSNPVVKTETKNNADGSTTKTETRKDGSVTQTTTGKDGSVTKTETKKDGSSVTENKAADGSTGKVKTDKNGQTEAAAKVSGKAVEDAKKNGEAVKVPVEVEATRNSSTAPTVSIELPKGAGETKVEIPVSNVTPGTVAVLVHPDGTEEILKDSIPTEDGIQLTVDGSATVKIVDNSKGFIDTQDHWAKDEIDFVSARGLVNGMSATIYAPNNSTTRAQLWTILARQADADLTGGNTWYEKAQNWAKDKGVSNGANPNAAINRAQMVTMLWRAVGQPTAGGTANFTDVPTDSYYAQAVAWAVENGITTGVGNGHFDPTGTCTRAQIAAFLARSMK